MEKTVGSYKTVENYRITEVNTQGFSTYKVEYTEGAQDIGGFRIWKRLYDERGQYVNPLSYEEAVQAIKDDVRRREDVVTTYVFDSEGK